VGAIFGAAILCAASSVVAAENPAPAVAILEAGWKSPTAGFGNAKVQYDKHRAAGSRDARTSYAMTLVAIRHRQARDAVRFIDDALAARPEHLQLRSTRLWIQVWIKDYKTILAEVRLLGKDVATAMDDPKQAQAGAAVAGSLGELLAYLRGPAEGAISLDQIAAVEQELRQALPLAALEAFTAAQESVDALHQQLSKELEEARVQAKDENDAKLAADLAKFEQARKVYSKQADQIQPRYEAISARLTAQLEQLQLGNRISYTRRSSGAIERSAGSNDARIAATQRQMEQLNEAAAAEVARLEKQDASAVTKIAQLQKQIKQAADSLVSENGRSAALRKRLTALSTYSEFPLEAERDKLMASFRGP